MLTSGAVLRGSKKFTVDEQYVGELAAFARRKGKEWFVAVMNGATPRKIRIPLSFLRGRVDAFVAMDSVGGRRLVGEDGGTLIFIS